MAVQKMPNGRWRARVKSGRVNVASRVFDTKRSALDWERGQKAAIDGGFDPRMGRSMTVKTAAEAWLQHREGLVASSTVKTDLRVISALPQAVLKRPVGALTEAEVLAYLKRLTGSAGTKQRVKISLSAFMQWAVKMKLRSDNPIRGVSLKSGKSGAMNPTSWEFIEAVSEAIEQDEYRRLVRIAGYTGLRWGELRAIRARDVLDFGGDLRLRVNRSWSEGFEEKDVKAHAIRHVPVAKAVEDDVVESIRGKNPATRIFTSPTGAAIHKSNFRRDCWNDVREGHSIQDLRHGAISEWVRLGVPLATVKVWAGHESLATTNRYAHSTGRADQEGVALINRLGGHQGDTLPGNPRS